MGGRRFPTAFTVDPLYRILGLNVSRKGNAELYRCVGNSFKKEYALLLKIAGFK